MTRCEGCLRIVPQIPGTPPECRCIKCQREETRETVNACAQRGWEARVVTQRGRLRVSVHTPIGEVTVHDRRDLKFLDVDVVA
jgi:hypothetical protein